MLKDGTYLQMLINYLKKYTLTWCRISLLNTKHKTKIIRLYKKKKLLKQVSFR